MAAVCVEAIATCARMPRIETALRNSSPTARRPEQPVETGDIDDDQGRMVQLISRRKFARDRQLPPPSPRGGR
jgi:hypothetical protein